MRQSKRVLFILKFRDDYTARSSAYSYGTYFSSGLYWSAKFVVDMLVNSGVDAKLVQVVDNNDIDREVSIFKPDVVIIEALWVVPEKFDVLKALYPNIRWIVRLHSNIPFLANDGIAMKWIKGYAEHGVEVAVNSQKALDDVEEVLSSAFLEDLLLYLPNYYPVGHKTAIKNQSEQIVRIGCYGALRPLKNQLIQAIAAIRYADESDKTLHFFINGTRMEQGGEAVRKNIRDLFAGTRHLLIEDSWFSHSEFLHRLRHLDVSMQVSLSETFSIVSADSTSVGVPIVVSAEVPWANWLSRVKATDGIKITEGIRDAIRFREINILTNRSGLRAYSKESRRIWLDELCEILK